MLAQDDWKFPRPESEIKSYTARRNPAPITIDGKLDEPAWQSVEWSPRFTDIITGGPVIHDTRSAVLWDDEYLYVAFRVEEPLARATFTNHNDPIWQDNDVEVFIAGPDANYEFEMNAFTTTYEVYFAWTNTLKSSGLMEQLEFKDAKLKPFNGVGFTSHLRGRRVGNFNAALPGLKRLSTWTAL